MEEEEGENRTVVKRQKAVTAVEILYVVAEQGGEELWDLSKANGGLKQFV